VPPLLTATVRVSVAAVELGPPAVAWVAEMVWLALLKGEAAVAALFGAVRPNEPRMVLRSL
jgi:hypothetical protein